MFFQGALLILLIAQLSDDLRVTRRGVPDRAAFLRTPIVRSLLLSGALVVLGKVLVGQGIGGGVLGGGKLMLTAVCVLVSFGISFAWYRYLVWLDLFEKERRRYLLLTFLLSCGTTLLVFPITDLIHRYTPLVLDGTAWNDWWYSALAIGGVEETVKLLPYLIMLRFSRQLNEPFDHVLYGCVSALGFAFMENVQYLERSGLQAFTGRAFTASVSHMFDTSIICYGIAMIRVRGATWRFLRGLGLLGLAALAHGFYDFWLLADDRPWIFTFAFYLATLQLWVVMKNNLINISPHYLTSAIKVNGTLRYGILSMFVMLFMGCAVLVLLYSGQGQAARFLNHGVWDMAGTLVLLTMTFSSFCFIRGRVAPLRVPVDIRRWFLPRFEEGPDLTGQRINVRLTNRGAPAEQETYIAAHLPVDGALVERVLYDGDADWFLFVPDHPVPLGEAYVPDRFLVNLHKDNDEIPDHDLALLRMRALKAPLDLGVAEVDADEASKSFFRVYARRLPDRVPGPVLGSA